MPLSLRSFPRGVAACLICAFIMNGCAGWGEWRSSGINYPVSITWNDTRWCVPLRLKRVLRKVSQRFGPVTVYSSHRWPLENRRKGGKKRSYHLTCRATDFAVKGDPAGVIDYLVTLPDVGGYSRYPQGFYHIDTGPRRTW
ncbi:MAG: D-Ala-D-Ala carboxypeptidase family metallohydrolase [Rhizobiaceae bacterium]